MDIMKELAGGAFNSFGSSRRQAVEASLFGADLMEISKALATSSSFGTDGSALNGYDLDPLVRYATLQRNANTPKIRRMHTFGAKALTTEWNRLTRRGNAEGNFRTQGALGVSDSSTLSRVTSNQKFLGRVGAVTRELQAAAGGSFGDAKAFELREQLTQFLLNLERDIWHSDSSLNSLAWDGLLAQMESGAEFNTDKAVNTAGKITAGGTLSIGDVRAVLHTIIRYAGTFNVMYCAPQERTAFGTASDELTRFYREDQMSNLGRGIKVDKIASEYNEGGIDIIWDQNLAGIRGKFLHNPEDPSDATKFHSEAPNQLSAALSLGVTSGGYLPDDTYYYGVAPVNEVGEGPIKLFATGQATASTNNTVQITVTHGSDVSNVKSYRLYRSTTSGADYTKMRLVKEIALASGAVAGGTQVLEDDGSIVPGSREAVLADEASCAMGELESPVVEDLPRIDGTHRFAIDAINDCILYVTQHMHRFYNIGGSVTDPA